GTGDDRRRERDQERDEREDDPHAAALFHPPPGIEYGRVSLRSSSCNVTLRFLLRAGWSRWPVRSSASSPPARAAAATPDRPASEPTCRLRPNRARTPARRRR